MSNYISNENQRLLWKMAHQIPLFSQLEPPKKEFEFKKVVEYFYQKVANRSFLTTVELQQLNRETLSVFLPKPPLNPTPSPNFTPTPVVPSVVPYEMVESKQEKSMRAFQERQDVYENMNKKPDLPNPEEIFREKNSDEDKIQNMDELIMNYQKQREMDFNAISPPTILPPSKKLKLLEETILTENDVDDIDIDKPNKKSVSWNADLLQPPEWQLKINSLEMKIKDLENWNEKLEIRMEELSKNIESVFTKEKKKMSKSLQKENEIPIIVESVLKDIVHKIEKMDNIKHKMKMFAGGI